MAPEQITLSTEAPAVPMPPFAFVYQFRWLNERSERAVYGFETIADALYDKPGIQPDDPGNRITVEVEPVIVRFEDLHERDRAAYIAAHAEYLTDCAEGVNLSRSMDHAIYYLEDGETVPTPTAVEIPPEAREEVRARIEARYPGTSTRPAEYQPGSYAEHVARREARLARKAEKRAEWAESREKKAEGAFKREHAILSVIPPGQPILVGHHSEKRHRRDLARAESACQQGIEHSKMAEHHAYKSQACAAALEKQYDPGFCYRRIEDGKRELRDAERRQARGQSNADDLIANATEKIAFWEARLGEVGGMRIALDQIKKGDTLETSWGLHEVVKVNKKTVTIKGWLRIPDMTYNIRLDDIKGIAKRAEA